MDSSATPAISPNSLHPQALVGSTPPPYLLSGSVATDTHRAPASHGITGSATETAPNFPPTTPAAPPPPPLGEHPQIRTHYDCHGEMLTCLPASCGTQSTAGALQSLQPAFKSEQSAMMERYLRQEKWEEPRPGASG